MTTYRAAPAAALRIVPLDAFTAVYHRPAGATHLLTEPAPEILAALQAGDTDAAGLRARLADRFELADDAAAAIEARLCELVAAGLVATS